MEKKKRLPLAEFKPRTFELVPSSLYEAVGLCPTRFPVVMVKTWDSIRVLDRGNFCSLDPRFEAGFGATSCVQCKIVDAFLIRVQCVGLLHVLNSSSAVVRKP